MGFGFEINNTRNHPAQFSFVYQIFLQIRNVNVWHSFSDFHADYVLRNRPNFKLELEDLDVKCEAG